VLEQGFGPQLWRRGGHSAKRDARCAPAALAPPGLSITATSGDDNVCENTRPTSRRLGYVLSGSARTTTGFAQRTLLSTDNCQR